MNYSSSSSSSSDAYTFLSDDWAWSEEFDIVDIAGILFFTLVILSGTFGNMLVVLAFYKNPSLRSHSINIYMVQTSVVNLIVSAVISPVYIITIFMNHKHLRTVIAVDYATLALMHLANSLSLYSLCAVATNRYLLIARPKTTFQIWCVPRRRIGGVLVGLWLVAITTSLPHWAFLYYDLYVVIPSKDAFDKLTIAGYILNSIWYLPIILVPIMHIATLRVIKSRRMRIEGHSNGAAMSSQRTDVTMNVVPIPHISSGIREPIGIVGTESAEIKDVGTGNDGITAIEAATVIEADGVNGLSGTTRTCCTRFCWTTHGALNVNPQRNRGLAESEMRLLKMMFLMYTILIISLVPAILSFTPIIQKGNLIVLGLFGFLIPVYPATMPYIFLWSNKNFRSAAAKLIHPN